MVGDQPESVVDLDPAKEGLECAMEPAHVTFQPACAATYLFSDFVESLHALLKPRQALLML